VPYSPEHPADWTLELLAEGSLPPDEQDAVAIHVERCVRCTAEVEAYQSLFAAMSAMPQFSPSPGFAEAVMTRVSIASPAAMPEWMTAWLPKTIRGWVLLVGLSMVPALPVIAAVWWVISNPQVSLVGLWDTGTAWLQDASWALLVGVLGTAVESNLAAWGRLLVDLVMGTPLEILVLGTLVLAVGIPVSAWTLYRTLRTPSRGTVYAH
jgi:anti-sigma factor RsiW